MTHTIERAKVYLSNGYCPTCEVQILDSGWVYVNDSDTYYPPNEVYKIDPSPES